MKPRTRKRQMAEINVVPYIDVMLVLLIIFMATAPLLNQGVEVELPKADAKPLPPSKQEPLVINVDKNGALFINYGDNQDQPISAEDLLVRVNALLKYQPKTKVLIGGDANVDYGRIVATMVLLQQAGVDSVGMITAAVDNP